MKNQPLNLSHIAHRQLIGWLGLAMPILVVSFATFFPVPNDPGGVPLASISAYFHTSAVGVFVGTLFALSMFLFSYPGYEGEKADRVLGKIAGIAALGVAFFPTKAPENLPPPLWWSAWMRPLHYTCAATLFVTFILFSLWLFRKSSAVTRTEMSAGKRLRNKIYLGCGIVMIASVLWAGSSLSTHGPIFLPEAIALVAFAVSWLTKGEAIRALAD